MGLSTCGKGEPNQTMNVGHAAPAACFGMSRCSAVDEQARGEFDMLMGDLEGLCLPGAGRSASFLGEDPISCGSTTTGSGRRGTSYSASAALSLIPGAVGGQGALILGADRSSDAQRLGALIERLRTQLAVAGDDPHLLYATEPHSTAEARTLRPP